MRILWVATKSPWPPVDGGRLVQQLTLEALADAGARVTVVAPAPEGDEHESAAANAAGTVRLELVPVRVRGPWSKLLAARPWGAPATIRLHRWSRVEARVEQLLAEQVYDLIHAEQLQAVAQTEPARRRDLPTVLRAQNVECDLWWETAKLGGPLAPMAELEARRLERWEGRRVREVDLAIALTSRDAERLGELAGGADVVTIPPPFPDRLPRSSRPLEGSPAVVAFASGGWPPNRDAVRWLLRSIWPTVEARLPGAVLHLFGSAGSAPDRRSVRHHPSPASSGEVFSERAIHVVPLRVASGIRMKILESWARGIPVVATPVAAAGLDCEHGRDLLLARDPDGFAEAIASVHDGSTRLRPTLVEGGRTALRTAHDPPRCAQTMLQAYRDLTTRS